MKHLLALALLLPGPTLAAAGVPVYKDRRAPVEKRIDDLIKRLTLDEKLSLIGGTGFGSRPIPRLGIPSIEMIDGPQGVRGPRATAFPSIIAMVATWNPELMRKTSAAIGREVRAIGKNMILGPCVTLYRVPQSGRNFECFGEDPFLNARHAAAYVRGTKDSNVLSSTKHFLLNNQETNRNFIDMSIDPRGLHELELPAFIAAIDAGTESIMSSYNVVHGLHASGNKTLLTDLLKNYLGFKGLIVSDWESTYNGWHAYLAGLDLEMPTGANMNAAALKSHLESRRLPKTLLNDKVRRLLRALFQIGAFNGKSQKGSPADLASAENRAIALKGAEEGIVLLKNDSVLPIDLGKVKSIAVVGPGAAARRIHGNGSGEVASVFYNVSVLEGLTKLAGPHVRVTHAVGTRPAEQVELIEKLRPGLEGGTFDGFRAEYFDNLDLKGKPVIVRQEPDIHVWNTSPPDIRLPTEKYSARWTGKFVMKHAGPVKFEVTGGKFYRITLNGNVLKDLLYKEDAWETEVDAGELAAGEHDLVVEHRYGDLFKFHLGWYPPKPRLEEAVDAARAADIAVVVVGTSSSFETEAGDRKEIALPGEQDAFIEEIVKANPRTIVVVNSGGPVLMTKWRDRVPAILQAWFAGQEGGHAAARIIAGLTNPSGKLPITIPKDIKDSPSSAYYWAQIDKIDYGKVGVLEGYRGYDAKSVEPEFPFGHGLSYTKFSQSLQLDVNETTAAAPNVRARVTVKNVGARAGAEVVQLYVSQENPKLVRPPKELKGFAKIELQPGESRNVVFDLDATAFRYWDPNANGWRVDADVFSILVGSSSRDIRARAKVHLTK